MTICKYKNTYFDTLKQRTSDFKCPESALAQTDFCIFHSPINYQDEVRTELKKRVEESTYNKEPLYCVGYRLPDICINRDFEIPVYFYEAKFYGEADFSQVKFKGEAKFSGATFAKIAIFSGATFTKEADFSNVKFHDNALFASVSFEKADFSLAEFVLVADFHIAHFGGAIFIGCRFKDSADFRITEFGDENFGVTKGASFGLAEFEKNADFSLSKFQRVDFVQTVFGENAIFTGAHFEKDAIFNAQFRGETVFSKAAFSDMSDFDSDCVFCGKTRFDKVKFSGYVHFASEFKNETDFTDSFFENSEKVTIDVRNLSNVSFLNTDISRIKFSEGVLWGEKIKKKYMVIDERKLEDSLKKNTQTLQGTNLGTLKALYRNLRENYEYRMRYDEAGEFFIREMELKRNYTESNSKIRRTDSFRRTISLTGVYYHLFRYGEKLTRLLVTSTFFFLLSVLSYWILNFAISSHPPLEWAYLSHSVVNATTTSLSDIFQIKNENLAPIDYSIRILSIPLLGVIVISLKRRFERKFRH